MKLCETGENSQDIPTVNRKNRLQHVEHDYIYKLHAHINIERLDNQTS